MIWCLLQLLGTISMATLSVPCLKTCLTFPSNGPFSCSAGRSLANLGRSGRMGGVASKASKSDVGSLEWMSEANPYEVLGLTEECSNEDVKDAFRAMIKEYHPDVYRGAGDADAITQHLIRAYDFLSSNTNVLLQRRKMGLDPFEEPECVAEDVFVNELACIGRGCPYSCVQGAPQVFAFAWDTGRARAIAQEQGGDYAVYTAAGQCPRNCIHFVTPLQRARLEEILQQIVKNPSFSDQVLLLQGLISLANFENGRFQPPKRQPKSSEKWVDWF